MRINWGVSGRDRYLKYFTRQSLMRVPRWQKEKRKESLLFFVVLPSYACHLHNDQESARRGKLQEKERKVLGKRAKVLPKSSRFRYSLFYVFGASSKRALYDFHRVTTMSRADFQIIKGSPRQTNINKINETDVTAGGMSRNNIRLFGTYCNRRA